MLYLHIVFFTGLFYQIQKSTSWVSSEEDQLCQVNVIRECLDYSLGLLEAIESGNERLLMKECDSLQTTINCFSVPRCLGNLSHSYRYFALTAAATLKKSLNACPNLDFEILERFFKKGSSMTCVDNESVKDICDRKCECQDGGLASCYRVRKEFTKMSLEERTHYLKVFKLFTTDPRYISEYEKIGKVHTVVPGKELFFPWHRWYVLTFENLLRQIDCRITIPYWDWTKDAAHWTRGSEIEDVWNPGAHGLGGNGVSPFNCVMDGSFKKGEYSLPQSAGGNCLKRHFNYSCTLQNAEQAKEIVKQPSYTTLRDTIYRRFHQTYHQCVGATLAFFKTAPYSPEFWLLHSFLDKLWVDWKKNNMDSKSDLTDIKYLMYETGHYAWEYLDADLLPGNVQVSYEE